MASPDYASGDFALRNSLNLLQQTEDKIRQAYSLVVSQDEDLSDHIGVIDACLNYLEGLHRHAPPNAPDSEFALWGLEVRLFNSGACLLKLVLAGYANGAVSFLRDILEITFLLDYFTADQTAIARWVTTPKAPEFKPWKIRDFLDKRDGFKEKKRGEIYSLLSSLGTHASYLGNRLTIYKKGLSIGPRLDLTKQSTVLADTAKYFPHAVNRLIANLSPTAAVQEPSIVARFNLTIDAWYAKYMGRSLINDPILRKKFEHDVTLPTQIRGSGSLPTARQKQ